jgi:xylulokinase
MKMPAGPALVAAVDCGTSAIKAGFFDIAGEMKAFATCPAPLTRHADGRVETDPELTFACAVKCLADCAAAFGAGACRVAALAISNQRATLVCSDNSGRAVGPAIIWQDMRGAPLLDTLRPRLPDRPYFKTTGLPNHPVFTLAKVLWVLRRGKRQYGRARRFGLLQDYLLRRFGAKELYCDLSNASLTGMLDVARLTWSAAILEAAGVAKSALPQLIRSGVEVGRLNPVVARAAGLPEGLPLISGGGDQQCAALGAGAAEAGVTVICMGTAAAPLCMAERVRRDPLMRVTTCAHAVPGRWNIEGLQNCAGASLQWLRRVTAGAGRFSRADLAAAVRVPPGARGILFYPHLDGAAAPHWNAGATALFLGLKLEHDRPALVRAVMEGVSLETREILEVFAALKLPCDEVRVTGGCSAIDAWNQIQADLFGKPVRAMHNAHATLLGAAMLAAVGAGLHHDCAAAARGMARARRLFTPRPQAAQAYDDLYRKYCDLRRRIDRNGIFDRLELGSAE